MKIAIITDACAPQANEVVNTLGATIRELKARGHTVHRYTATMCNKSICVSRKEEIHLALDPWTIKDELISNQYDAVHIATEGTLGFWAARYLSKRSIPHTTSYHTKWPEYLKARFGVPARWTYKLMRWFHRKSKAVLVADNETKIILEKRGFQRVVTWGRGTDTELGENSWKGPTDVFEQSLIQIESKNWTK